MKTGGGKDFKLVFGSRSLMITVRFCSASESFKTIRFVFCSNSVNVEFEFGLVLGKNNWHYIDILAVLQSNITVFIIAVLVV